MKEIIANFLGLDMDEIYPLTDSQKKALRESTTNLYQMPAFYTMYHIIFTSKSALQHWQYYAGFEYLDDPETYNRDGDYIAAYSVNNDQDNRVQKFLTIIENAE